MEEDILNMTFDTSDEQASFIKVVGVGGGGSNAVNHMYRQGIKGVDFVVCNTDQKSLAQSPVPTKIKLGKGLGAGNDPKVAEAAAREKADEIRDIISDNTKMIFITAGMGGGTGTGAAPVIAEIAKQINTDDDIDKILVVAIVTFPLAFEGPRRKKQAEEGIAELRKHVDSILIINNDKLREFGNMKMSEAFAKADDVLLTAAKGIAEIITVEGYVAVDFRDVNSVMANSGTALMGAGVASGENRAIEAITLASTSVLLNDNDIAGAKDILLYFSYSMEHEIDFDEVTTITDYIKNLTGEDTNVIWGMGPDESLGENLSITLIATGFESKKIEKPSGTRTIFESDDKEKTNATKAEKPADVCEPTLNQRADETPIINPNAIYGGSSEENVRHEPKRFTLDDDPVTERKTTTDTVVEDPVNDIRISSEENKTQGEYNTERTVSINARGEIINKPKRSPISESEISARERRIRDIHSKLRSAQGLSELESTPAYELMGKNLSYENSEESSVRSRIDEYGNITNGAAFLHKTPD